MSSLVSQSTKFARSHHEATPRARGLTRVGQAEVLTWSLAGLWLLDAILQFQPYMFSAAFPKEVLAPAGEGGPAWVSGPVTWSSTVLAHHLVLLNTLFALTQLALAIGIVMPRTRKPALVASVVWAVLVWWLGEGFGMVFTGPVSPLMGLPGAVILYAVAALLLWPADREPAAREAGSMAVASPLRAVGAKAVWVALWLLFAVEQLAPANRAPSALHDMVAGMADGEPAWIQSIDHLGATLLAGRGTGVSIVLATLFALVALGIMAPTRLRRAALVLAMVLAALIWVFGQDFGALATGRATDPNSGPLLILVAWCYWPRSRVRSTEDGGTMTGRLATADPRRHKQAKEITRVLRLAGTAGAGLLALSAITSCGTAQSTAGATSAATSATSSTSAPPSSRSTPSSMARAAAMIHISSFKYAVPASVAPGATVSVMNMDGENHTVTADSGNAFDVMATAGTTVTFTAPKKPGTYPFHCTYHSNMHGVLVVK